MKSSTVVLQNFPLLASQLKRRVLTGVRPFRKGGIRLERENIDAKIVVHNYGHGGAGVSLAPATAEEAADLAFKSCQSGSLVTVLGCGIVGLLTALQCVNKGLKVVIQAERIPGQITDLSILSTSQVAPGYWLPYHYQFSDQKQHDARSDRSYQKYLEWMQTSKSLRKVQVFEDMDIEQIKQKAPPFVSDTCKPITLSINDKSFKMIYFETIQIHLQNFLSELISLCKAKDVKFENRKITGLNDILHTPTKVIINCMGLGSKYIFNDKNVYGVKGHLLEMENSTKIKGIYGFKHENGPVKLYCFDEKILIGLTKEEKQDLEINHKLVESLEKRVYGFYNFLNLKPGSVKPKL